MTPTFSSWLDTSQAAAYGNNYAYNPAKALSILKNGGLQDGSDGVMTKGGKKLSFSDHQQRRLLGLGRRRSTSSRPT